MVVGWREETKALSWRTALRRDAVGGASSVSRSCKALGSSFKTPGTVLISIIRQFYREA